jgi:hypothetical protein
MNAVSRRRRLGPDGILRSHSGPRFFSCTGGRAWAAVRAGRAGQEGAAGDELQRGTPQPAHLAGVRHLMVSLPVADDPRTH